jgi:hypothetical protein
MKIIILLILSVQAFALRFSVSELCSDSKYLDTQIEMDSNSTVSEVTLDTFSLFGVEFLGDERSISSIIGTPTGLEAYEVISDNEMRIYGWCFEVDGVQPDRFMHEINIDPKIHSHINWFFGSAHYKDGAWLTYCTPSFENKSPFICKN